MSKSNECLAHGCQEDEYARGLCRKHYQLALKAVNQGIATWEQLVEQGLAAPEKKRGPTPSEFTQQIEAIGQSTK